MLPLVTKEQAILLKEEGFDLPMDTLYLEEHDKLVHDGRILNFNDIRNCYSAPTVSEALLWLEDNKGFQFGNKRFIEFWNIYIYYKGQELYERFTIYNSRLFQSKQLDMALEILKSENK